jgi:fatty acid desaturase
MQQGESTDPADYLASFRALAGEFRRRGYPRPQTARILRELVLHLSLALGGMLLFLCTQSIGLRGLGVLISTAGMFGIATNTHTASHHAASPRRRSNLALTFFGFPFLLGISANHWDRKHCVLHHANPNVVGNDSDIDFMPLFAINQSERGRATGALRVWFACQWLIVPFALALNALNMQRQGVIGLVGSLRAKPTRLGWLDLGCLLGHYGLWLALPMLWFSAQDLLLFYTVRLALLGYAVFMVFAPAHLPSNTPFIATTQPASDRVLRQTVTTANFEIVAWARVFCSGLGFQIEHHLFPRIDHFYYPQMSPDVQAFCERHGYPYHRVGWWQGVRESLAIFYRPKPIEAALRAPARGPISARD